MVKKAVNELSESAINDVAAGNDEAVASGADMLVVCPCRSGAIWLAWFNSLPKDISMNKLTKIVLASGLSWGTATALASAPTQEVPKQRPTPMTDSQMDATTGAGIENRPITPPWWKKPAAKKPVAKKAALRDREWKG